MKRPTYSFTVLGKQQVTANMLRVTLGGDGLNTFPTDQASAYVKLIFPVPGQERPLLRTYTVRDHRDEGIDIDFALHGDGGGPACRWARTCQPGDRIDIAGPGPKKLVDNDADWIVMVGDMTALPAISVNLEQLPAHACGHAIIEISDAADQQDLPVPDNIALQWVVNPTPGQATPLVDAVASLDWPDARHSIWCACEFNSMLALRKHFRDQRGVAREHMYISSYWIHGCDEGEHKTIKRADAERQ